MKDDVADLDPPDQRVARVAVASRVALRTMQIDANVWPIGDLKPEPLSLITGPPRVDPSGLTQPVLSHGIYQPHARGMSPDKKSTRNLEQHRAHKRAAVAEGRDADLHFAFVDQTPDPLLDPVNGHQLTVRRTSGGDQNCVAADLEDRG
jgi:hypothetical protein